MLHVLYMTATASLFLRKGGEPNENQLHNFFKVVQQFDDSLDKNNPEEILNKVWLEMQADVWSPNGEKDDLLSSLDVDHTDMRLGDMVYCDELKKLWRIKTGANNFDEVVITDLGTEKPMNGEQLHTVVPIHNTPTTVAVSSVIPKPLTAWEKALEARKGRKW